MTILCFALSGIYNHGYMYVSKIKRGYLFPDNLELEQLLLPNNDGLFIEKKCNVFQTDINFSISNLIKKGT
jgi:hypothetical protein